MSGNGRWLAGGSADNSIHVWDLQTGLCSHTMPADESVRSISLSFDARFVMAGYSGGKVRLWDVGGEECVWETEGSESYKNPVALSPNYRFALIGGADNALKVVYLDWDMTAE